MWVMWAFNEFMNYLRILLDCFSKVVVILWCWNRFRKNWTCLIKVFYPDCSNRWGFSKTHVQVWVWFEGTPNFHFLFSFPSVIYIQVITLFATEPMFFVSERGRVPRVVVCEVVHTHVIFLHLCVWFWPCVCVCVCTRCVLWGQGHCFHSPSPSLPHPICHECHASGWKLRESPQENGCFHIANGEGEGATARERWLRCSNVATQARQWEWKTNK